MFQAEIDIKTVVPDIDIFCLFPGTGVSGKTVIDDLEAGRLVPVLGGWHRPSHQNYVVCKEDDWKIRQIRMFSNWWAQKLGDYEKECEARLVKLYGRKFFLNLIH